MMNIRIATSYDKEEWNKVAAESHEATYSHIWEWKEVLEKGLGVETLYLLAEDKDEVTGIYPGFILPFKKKGLLSFINNKFSVIFSPFYETWDYGGPCVLSGSGTKIYEELVNGMEKFAKKRGGISIRVSPFEGDALKNILLSHHYRTSERLTPIINLSKSEDELWKNVDKRTRKYVKVAENNGIIIKEAHSDADIREIYNCISHTHNRVGAYLPPYDFFLKIHEKLGEKGISRFRLALIDDKVIGGDLLYCFNNMVVERYRGIYEEYLELRTNYLMVWTAIKESKKMGFGIYDQGGVSKNSEGIYFFKTRWGGEIKNVDWYAKDIRFEKIRMLMRR